MLKEEQRELFRQIKKEIMEGSKMKTIYAKKQGRIGKEQEFVEYDLTPTFRLVIQKSGDKWVAYLVQKGRNGMVRTYDSYGTRQEAELCTDAAFRTLRAWIHKNG